MTAEEYRALLDVDFNNVKIEDLTDIRKIKRSEERRVGMMIKVSFANNGLSMEQAFENLLLNV